MCGFVGLLSHDPDILARIGAMNRTIRHRGPDDEGFAFLGGGESRHVGGPDTPAKSYTDAFPYTPTRPWDGQVPEGSRCAFGHRRLSILDLSPAGHQPLCYGDGRYWITYNGEVYNYVELRQELETLGHRFLSRGDTEIIAAAYAQWGADCLRRFKGMWAFMLVDLEARDVFLARDPFGIKPLYYAPFMGGIAFASEVKAILELPHLSRQVDPTLLHHYIYSGYCHEAPRTLLADVKQMPPAHWLKLALDAPVLGEPVRYWQIDLDRRLDLSVTEAAEQVRDLFLDSIRLHLRSDVPVGGALSGGIDSSAVVMGMRHVEGPDLQLHAFSYIADDPALTEERWVDVVTGAAKAEAHKIWPSPDDLASELEHLVHMQDLPVASTSIYAQHRVFRLAQEKGIKVMLDGQGADETWAGYLTYVPFRLRSLIRRGAWGELIHYLRAGMTLPTRDFLLRALIRLGIPPALSRFLDTIRGYDGRPAWLRHDWFEVRQVRAYAPPGTPGKEAFRLQLHHTLVETSLPPLLRYEDRNSMAHAIESRVPFLIPELVELAFALPETHLLSAEGESKSVFRRAMRGIVPDLILDRKDKIGFATPEKGWLIALRPWVEQQLTSETARSIPVLNPEAMVADYHAMVEGRMPWDGRFWRWINLIGWTERYKPVY